MPESEEQRERRAIEAAENRAKETARIEGHLAEHDRQLSAISATVNQTAGEQRAVSNQLNTLASKFEQSMAVTAARADDAAKAARKQVTSRELYITAIGVTASITVALAAAGAFH